MITLIRLMILNYRRTRIKLAFYTAIDKLLKEFEKDPQKAQNELTEALLKAQFDKGMFKDDNDANNVNVGDSGNIVDEK